MAEILFEYVRQGTCIKVTAIDVETQTEAVVVVPVGLSEKDMQTKALQKLMYLLQKKGTE